LKQDINLMMVGSRGTGKTTYMLAMYAVMSGSVKGFSFSAQDMDDDLELAGMWDHFLETGEWPSPTDTSRSWAFDFNHALKRVKGFNWFDYRGGLLHEQKKDNPTERGEFLDKLKQSDCVILCVAGDQLAKYVDDGSRPQGVRELGILMTQFYKERHSTIPVAVAITKADQCPGDKLMHGIQALRTDLLSHLFVPDAGWLVMFCPVSMGRNLPAGKNPQCLGLIAPENVHLPVTFALYFQLEAELRETEERLAGLAGEQAELQSRVADLDSGFWSSLFKRGEIRSGRERVSAIKQSAQLTDQEARQFKEHMQNIRDELIGSQTQIYFSGRRVELHNE
jgi:hypothetical protein